MAGRLDSLRDTVGKYNCERCSFSFSVDELVEEEETGAVVCKKCYDQSSFDEQKRDEGREAVDHHFQT